jgi:hypothetical protein
MDYAKIYEDFYSKYYTKTEGLIKLYFIKCKSENRTFGYAINNVRVYLTDTVKEKHIIFNNKTLGNLHLIFATRFSSYESDEIQSIFANEIKTDFDKIKKTDLPKEYNYAKFIKDVASLEIMNEILRLLTQNSRLLNMFYKANYFDEFEIRTHSDYILEHYPLYRKLDLLLNPLLEDNKSEITNHENILFEQRPVFKIALKFATGEAQELYQAKKHLNGHFKIICLELGFKATDRPYFSETINESNSDKNVLKKFALIQYLVKYCETREIKLCDYFLLKMKELEKN